MNYFALLAGMALLFTISSTAQTVYTKDGMALGDRKELVKACVDGVKEEMTSLDGKPVKMKKMCSCMVDEMMPNLEFAVFMAAAQEGQEAMNKLIMRDDIFPLVLACASENKAEIEAAQGDVEMRDLPGGDALFMKSCMAGVDLEMAKDPSIAEIGIDWEMYCQCVMDESNERGMSLSEMLHADDTESEAFQEVIMPCMLFAMGAEENVEGAMDEVEFETEPDWDRDNATEYRSMRGTPSIEGQALEVKLPLTQEGESWSVKIEIGDEIVTFRIDPTQAKTSVTDKVYWGAVTAGMGYPIYPPDSLGVFVEPQEVLTKHVLVMNMNVGGYEVRMTEMLGTEGDLCVLGQDVLGQFIKWEILKEENALLLVK